MFGRRSYEAFATVLAGSADHAAYRELPKYIVSSTLGDDDVVDGWGPQRVLRSLDDVAAVKREEGGSIYVHGSPELARALSEPGWSTGTTCSSSQSCSEQARASSAAPTSRDGGSRWSTRPRTATES
jgi:hypothetical protein